MAKKRATKEAEAHTHDREVKGTGIEKEQKQEAEQVSEKIEVDEQDGSKKAEKDISRVENTLYNSRRIIFILGALVCVFAASFFSTNHSSGVDLDSLVNINLDSVSSVFEDWKDALPTSLQSMIGDIKNAENLSSSAESFSVGKRMLAKHNLTSNYNVVMVPGVISTGIESWNLQGTEDCPSIGHFRKRLWGSFYMLRTMVLDKNCWLKHIMLDRETGLDPPNITLRAAQGFDAADFFVAGYWIWNKILQNLAVIGYNPNNMLSAAYDWRLAYYHLEERDLYFSKLKRQIEIKKSLRGQKTALVGHSMGSQVAFYFMKWAEAMGEGFGNGGPKWCNDHIAAFVDISGSLLGTPKAVPALISGEMRDTVQLNALAVYGLEKFFSKNERAEMLRTFGGIPSMLPKGGNLVWGDLKGAHDDPSNALITDVKSNETDISGPHNETFGTFLHLKEKNNKYTNLTIEESINYLLQNSPSWFSKRAQKFYSFGIAKKAKEIQANEKDHSKWSNPLEVALPNAPDMVIYSFYGVGKPTERSYTYKEAGNSTNLKAVIDLDSNNPFYLGDGDGTLSIMTHLILHEWQKGKASRYNPGNSEVKIVEIKHEPDRFDIRGGAKTADHVDILGSAELNELVLKVAAGRGDLIKNRYFSKLHDIVSNMNI